jgi:hypothetical protein
MRKADEQVREVLCSETGKPMPKIPLWMADIKVKFVCDEARQKIAPTMTLIDPEPLRKSGAPADSPLSVLALGDEPEPEEYEEEEVVEELPESDYD